MKSRKLWYSLLFATILPLLGGCEAVPHLGLAVATAPTLFSSPSTDSDEASLELVTPVSGDAFISDARAIARKLEYQVYQVMRMPATPGGALTPYVVLYKEASMLRMYFGSYSMQQITLSLGEDGRMIRVAAQIHGNGGSGDEGEARKVINTFKAAFAERYASK